MKWSARFGASPSGEDVQGRLGIGLHNTNIGLWSILLLELAATSLKQPEISQSAQLRNWLGNLSLQTGIASL